MLAGGGDGYRQMAGLLVDLTAGWLVAEEEGSNFEASATNASGRLECLSVSAPKPFLRHSSRDRERRDEKSGA